MLGLPEVWWEGLRREASEALDRAIVRNIMSGTQIINSGDTVGCSRATAHGPHSWNYNVNEPLGALMVECPGLVHREGKRFQRIRLNRQRDVSGVSGTGIVAYGVIWPDGSVTLRWDTKVRSTVQYDSIEDVQTITGHGGNTVIEWVDQDDHIITIYDNGWFLEHSDECRVLGRISTCAYTVWADEHVGCKPPQPYGRFKMQIPDAGGMILDGAV